MSFSYKMRLIVLVTVMSVMAAAQDSTVSQQSSSQQPGDSSAQQSGDSGQDQRTAPSPAFGQTAPILSPENPPISGIDEPRLDLRTALRSFISGGLVASESADTNAENQLSNTSGVRSVTHLLGALDLQRFWPKSDLFAEYMGGGSFYTSGLDTVRQMQALGVLAVTRWRTGQVELHSTFDYLPEGSFGGGGFGGSPGLGIAETGGIGIPGGNLPGSHSFGGSNFGSVGLVSRITDVTVAEVTQSLTPRSAVTLVGGYSVARYLELQDQLADAQQISVEAGYSYLLTRRDQIGIVGAFRDFHFPQTFPPAGRIEAEALFFRWGRTISGRMSIILGAGPQYLSNYQPAYVVEDPGPPPSLFTVSALKTHNWSGAGRAALHYQFPRTSLTASYEKFTSSGSGFYAGADTQLGRLTVARPLSHTLDFTLDAGYSHNKRLDLTGFGASSAYYNSGFAGAILRRRIGRDWGVFGAYHFDELRFDHTECFGTFGCGRTTVRQVGTLGVDWHFRPIRIE